MLKATWSTSMNANAEIHHRAPVAPDRVPGIRPTTVNMLEPLAPGQR